MQEKVQSNPDPELNVLPLSLYFLDQIHQNALTIFKRCSHRPAEGRERAKHYFQMLNIPTATNKALACGQTQPSTSTHQGPALHRHQRQHLFTHLSAFIQSV